MDTIGVRRTSEGEAVAVRSRRRWPVEEKLRIVLETLEPGVSVPVVARRHSVNANQLFIWRGQYQPSSTEASRLLYRSMIAVSNGRRRSLGTRSLTSPALVSSLRS